MKAILGDHPHVCLTCPQRDGCSRDDCMYGNPPEDRCCGEFGRCEIAESGCVRGGTRDALPHTCIVTSARRSITTSAATSTCASVAGGVSPRATRWKRRGRPSCSSRRAPCWERRCGGSDRPAPGRGGGLEASVVSGSARCRAQGRRSALVGLHLLRGLHHGMPYGCADRGGKERSRLAGQTARTLHVARAGASSRGSADAESGSHRGGGAGEGGRVPLVRRRRQRAADLGRDGSAVGSAREPRGVARGRSLHVPVRGGPDVHSARERDARPLPAGARAHAQGQRRARTTSSATTRTTIVDGLRC